MAKNTNVKSYVKSGIVAAVVIAVAALGVWGISALRQNSGAPVADAIAGVSGQAANAGDLRLAVIRMDAILADASALKDLRAQKEKYENELRDELTKDQKELEKEKKEIEESQDILSREALQRRVVEYQEKVTKLQRELTERAQSVEQSYQKALSELQAKHLDPIIEGVINKKNLSLVIDGRMARIGTGVEGLDITDEVIKAFDKKISKMKMEKPKGF
ncbi:MAG: OmpH family outer membrane protein [Alphaproteobacteria bacterium]